jgi:hypothetical protein
LHVAETRRDEPQLQAVEALAREQLSRIDALAPENRMSSAAAERRRGVNLYAGLARQAATQARVVRVRRQLSRRRPEERPA